MMNRLLIVGLVLVLAARTSDLTAAEQDSQRAAGIAADAKSGPEKAARRSTPEQDKPSVSKHPAKTGSAEKPARNNPDLGSLEELELGAFTENEAEVELLSGNKAELFSGNKAELLSGNKPALCSGERSGFLSGNTAKIVSKVRVLSGIKFQVNITIQNSGNRPDAGSKGTDTLFGSLDRDGDGQLSPDEFRQALQKRTAPASF